MHSDKPSATALFIAKSQLLLAGDPGFASAVGGARSDYYRAFVGAVTGRRELSAVSRLYFRFLERITIPGIYLHYAWRKQRIEQITRDFLAKSRDAQVVVIAAGFDPLAAMLSREYPEAAFFEIDHPATQHWKKAALESMGHRDKPKLMAVDLAAESIVDALQGADFSSKTPALFIAEGITMYLNEAQVRQLFQQVRSCACSDACRFVFTYMNRGLSGSIQFVSATRLVDWWLWLKKESFQWGIASDELGAFLASTGWRPVSIGAAGEASPDPTKGENLCVAEKA